MCGQQGITVLFCLVDRLACEITRRTRAILDYKRLSKTFVKLFSEDARYRVHPTSGRDIHDDLDRLFGITGCRVFLRHNWRGKKHTEPRNQDFKANHCASPIEIPA